MNCSGDPYVIEYNARMGDPETQAVLPRIKNDFVDLLIDAAEGNLSGKKVESTADYVATVVMVSGGYPGDYQKGKAISGLGAPNPALVFHAGSRQINGHIVTDGGRVLAITGRGADMASAREKAYAGVAKLSWEGVYFRKDIGMDLMNLK
jgi:phosphoribosylamine--glycine ligase